MVKIGGNTHKGWIYLHCKKNAVVECEDFQIDGRPVLGNITLLSFSALPKFRCSDAIGKKMTTKSGSNLNTVGKFAKVKRLCMTEVTSQLGQTFK